jgi:single-stranded-DNA-specific exonuclease
MMDRPRWQPRCTEVDATTVTALARDLGLSPELAGLLVARGYHCPEQAGEFLTSELRQLPDPFLLKGMETAVQRLQQALDTDELIVVHGDYDVDGISATALLVSVLRQFGGRADFHIPLRMEDGYGLSSSALATAAAAGAAVVVSVDCGVSAFEEAAVARQLGLDLIITDHHQPKDLLPVCTALINPHQPDCDFPDNSLSGVGVAFFLAAGLRKRLRECGYFAKRPEPDLRLILDLVALGTIADLVPLTGVNRILVRAGLERIQLTGRPGLQALKQVADVQQVSCGSVGFRLAPRLNAAGRLEDARLAVELLLTDDLLFARKTAAELDSFNQQRQALEQQIFAEAVARVETLGSLTERYSLVLADAGWHQGVIGIVASRMVEKFHRPVVMIALDDATGKGSARSIRGFHLFQGLQDCSGQLTAFGGHEYAAGLSLAAENLQAFGNAFEAAARAQIEPADLLRTLVYDQELLLEEVSEPFGIELEKLAPFGAGNPEPVFLASGLLAQQLQPVGRDHLRFQCRQGGYSFPAIAFGMAERRELFEQPFDLLFSLSFNEWRGRRSLQLRVRDVRPTAELPGN